ncbi:hypothetical protein, partial [Escherichia coli]|uniref:hypothetical protein n=1 Tax=Escherichia coli TaxID=562 RepID=UPI001AD91BBE
YFEAVEPIATSSTTSQEDSKQSVNQPELQGATPPTKQPSHQQPRTQKKDKQVWVRKDVPTTQTRPTKESKSQ